MRNGIKAEGDGSGWGLMMLWSEEISVSIQRYCTYFIDAEIDATEMLPKWRFTGFYCDPVVSRRRIGWQLMKELSEEVEMPWVVEEISTKYSLIRRNSEET